MDSNRTVIMIGSAIVGYFVFSSLNIGGALGGIAGAIVGFMISSRLR